MLAELDERKQKILACIVQDYIGEAEPVGSENIFYRHRLDISPATIRNEMVELEKGGYLRQPHTSAGRIPTDRGYRFYVDHLMRIRSLTPKEEEFIRRECARIEYDLEDILHQILKVLSSLSHYTTVAMAPPRRVYAAGLPNLLRQPEFRDAKHLSLLLQLLEQEDLLSEVLSAEIIPQTITIKIGSEIRHRAMRECSLVATAYEVKGKTMGTLGVIGPTRMNYGRIASEVNYVARTLGNLLSEVF